jgi:hypothetical protein
MGQSIDFGINDWRNQLFQVQMSVYAKAVGCALASYYRDGQLCYPSIQTLCMDCCLSKPTVIKAIKELEEHKFITIRKKQLKYLSALTNYYEFNGITNSQSDSKDDSKSYGKSDSKTHSKPHLPEVREIREVSKTISSDKSLDIVKPREKKKIASVVPDDWQPGEVTAQKLKERGLDVSAVVEKFKNSCHAKGLKYIDFDRAILAWDWSSDKTLQIKENDNPFKVHGFYWPGDIGND